MSDIYLFKIVIIGETEAGKTSIMKRLCDNIFSNSGASTLGINDRKTEIEVMNRKVTLHLWDTAGQDRFRSINRRYYQNASGAALIFDLTSLKSFQGIPIWLKEFRDSVDRGVLVLIGNKLDLVEKRIVSFEEAQSFARNNGMRYIEASAKDGTGITEAFSELSEKVLKRVLKNGIDTRSPSQSASLRLSTQKNAKSGCC